MGQVSTSLTFQVIEQLLVRDAVKVERRTQQDTKPQCCGLGAVARALLGSTEEDRLERFSGSIRINLTAGEYGVLDFRIFESEAGGVRSPVLTMDEDGT